MRQVLFDPYQMVATAQRLAKAGVTIQEFPQSVPNLTAASQQLYELIQGQASSATQLRRCAPRSPAASRSRAAEAGASARTSKVAQDRRRRCSGDGVPRRRAGPCRAGLRQTYRGWQPGYVDPDARPAQAPAADQRLRELYQGIDDAIRWGCSMTRRSTIDELRRNAVAALALLAVVTVGTAVVMTVM